MSTKAIWLIILLLVVVFIGVLLFANTGETPSVMDDSDETTDNQDSNMKNLTPMRLTSPAFTQQGTIPEQFTCDGENVNPPLSISGTPDSVESLTLIMDDPDIPEEVQGSLGSSVFDHWVMFNIDPTTKEVGQGEALGTEGRNSSGENGYTGPCPPPQYEPTEHRYIFKLYALDSRLELNEGASKAEVLSAMEGHILAETELVGRYDRSE